MTQATTTLLLPGWQNSDVTHWQSRWEAVHGDRRVEQHDWMRPKRGDWSARLEDEVLAAPGPVVLVAHSLGCILVAAWAAHSRHTGRVPRRAGGPRARRPAPDHSRLGADRAATIAVPCADGRRQ